MSIPNLMCDDCGSKMNFKVVQHANVLIRCPDCERLYYFLDKDMFKMLGIKFHWEIKAEKEWEKFVKMASNSKE